MNERNGGWISFEGIDGSGKTSIANKVYRDLRTQGFNTLLAKDPPEESAVGLSVRNLVTYYRLLDLTQAMVITAARSDYYHKYVKPALSDGRIVISDRNIHTSLVYQPNHTAEVFQLHNVGLGRYPDKVIVLDVPVELAIKRCRVDAIVDTCENVPVEEWERRRQGFIDLGSLPDVDVVYCDDKNIDEVYEMVKGCVVAFLENEGRFVKYGNRKHFFYKGGYNSETEA